MKNEPENLSAPVQPGPRPKMPICPDCGALMQTGFYRVSQNSESAVRVRCQGNDLSFHQFVISNFGDLRRFFPVAAPSAPPRHTFILDVLPAKKLLALRDEVGELQAVAESHIHEEFDSCDVCGERGELRQKGHEYRQMAQDVAAHLADQVMFFAKLKLEQIESIRGRVPTTKPEIQGDNMLQDGPVNNLHQALAKAYEWNESRRPAASQKGEEGK